MLHFLTWPSCSLLGCELHWPEALLRGMHQHEEYRAGVYVFGMQLEEELLLDQVRDCLAVMMHMPSGLLVKATSPGHVHALECAISVNSCMSNLRALQCSQSQARR